LNQYQTYIHQSRYARWIAVEKRRETWEETVDRYIRFFSKRMPQGSGDVMLELRQNIADLNVMPSMRALMTAGPALEKDNVAGYNCSYIAIDDPRAFDEAAYISMCFHPDTLIEIKNGLKKISEILATDEVVTYNQERNEVGFSKPERILENPTSQEEKIELTFDDGSIVKCTANHLFLTKNRGWVEAKNLLEIDEL